MNIAFKAYEITTQLLKSTKRVSVSKEPLREFVTKISNTPSVIVVQDIEVITFGSKD